MIALASLTIGLGATSAFGDDAKLRAEARELLGVVRFASDAEINAPDARLGRALFWDQRISADGKTACASCHLRKDHGSDSRVFSRRATGKLTKRNSQSVFNSMLQPALRWTGNRKTGADQAAGSLTGSLGLESREAAVELIKKLGYEPAFRKAYPADDKPVTAMNFGRAIEAYEDTLTTPSAYDKFLTGDDNALTDQRKTGLRTFIETGCADCHSGPLLGGTSMEKFGLTKEYWKVTGSKNVDLGRFDDTQLDKDKSAQGK